MSLLQRELRERPASRLLRWLLAAALVVLLHGAGAALGLYKWPEEEMDADPNGAFLLEFAPVTTAPPPQDLNLALGPLAQEAVPTVASTEEVKETSEVETPPVDPSPAPDPEVALPEPKEVEETKEEKKEDQQPETKAEEQTAEAASQATAPPPVEAEQGEKLAAQRAGMSTKPSEAVLSWHKALVAHLNRHKKYPREARRAGEEGTALVAFTLDRSGKVLSARLISSSGSASLDEEAVTVFERASPFPAPPADMKNLSLTLNQPLKFQIKD